MSNVIVKEDVEHAVRSYFNTMDFTIERYEERQFSDAKVGFMGRHFRITAWVTISGTQKQIDFFAKLAPTSETQYTAKTTSNYFTKEVFTYTDLAPRLNSCLPQGNTLPLPRCVLGRDEKTSTHDRRILILEDVTRKNYKLLEDVRPLDFAHCKAVLKSLGKFHASSLLLQGSLVEEKGKTRQEVAKSVFRGDSLNWMSSNNWAMTCARSMATASALLWPERFAESTKTVIEKLDRAWERVYAMAYDSDKYANVLCHADLWINNMLFSYESNASGEEVPVDVVFVDFQFVHYTPPALDVLLFLHLCTHRDFRNENWRSLLEYYHSEVGKYIPNHTLKEVYPLSSLFESFEEFREYGRLKSTGYLPTVLEGLVPKHELDVQEPDVLVGMLRDRGHQIYRYCQASEAYRSRIEESFQECLEGLDLWN
ncbi:uncharacterized protein LOC124158758 [Ischnura elegans]|uniref:uncharacterized protein LOC124158758 n=1 Tax=Ischnura elegans TaxID=197161 RepID=UPI001ED88903|nr:uncharacterized protein LOC124158758 [Ischnura elegans]